MSEKIVVPVLGESITEAKVEKWLKNAGDAVEEDEPIVELETDKVNLEVPSPISGVLTEINSKDGSVVEVGALLGSVSENGSGGSVKKVEPTQNEDNVIKLDTSKKEPKIFEEKTEENIQKEPRSEEHTSELQSRSDLVCRILLEKKKEKKKKKKKRHIACNHPSKNTS